MEDYQERVIEEKKELDEKIDKLTVFIKGSGIYDDLDTADQYLLCFQLDYMLDYTRTLEMRINQF